MSFEQRDNSGALFKNERREKDTHPHATGTALIDGVEYYISAWTKEGKNGKFQSLSFKRKNQNDSKKQGQTKSDFDDDLPF